MDNNREIKKYINNSINRKIERKLLYKKCDYHEKFEFAEICYECSVNLDKLIDHINEIITKINYTR